LRAEWLSGRTVQWAQRVPSAPHGADSRAWWGQSSHVGSGPRRVSGAEGWGEPRAARVWREHACASLRSGRIVRATGCACHRRGTKAVRRPCRVCTRLPRQLSYRPGHARTSVLRRKRPGPKQSARGDDSTRGAPWPRPRQPLVPPACAPGRASAHVKEMPLARPCSCEEEGALPPAAAAAPLSPNIIESVRSGAAMPTATRRAATRGLGTTHGRRAGPWHTGRCAALEETCIPGRATRTGPDAVGCAIDDVLVLSTARKVAAPRPRVGLLD
jgi:hypothetical protein